MRVGFQEGHDIILFFGYQVSSTDGDRKMVWARIPGSTQDEYSKYSTMYELSWEREMFLYVTYWTSGSISFVSFKLFAHFPGVNSCISTSK